MKFYQDLQSNKTMQEEHFHWNLYFAILLMVKSLNLNSVNYFIFLEIS